MGGILVPWAEFKKIFFLSGALAALVFVGAELFMQFGRGHYGKASCEVILNLD